jgi:hypothetical protein
MSKYPFVDFVVVVVVLTHTERERERDGAREWCVFL